jgi:hypothetical protein
MFSGFWYTPMPDLIRWMDDGGVMSQTVCGREKKGRLLADEVLFALDGDTEKFEADVMLEGMDVPVADT